MSESVLEFRKARAQAWFETLRDDICAACDYRIICPAAEK